MNFISTNKYSIKTHEQSDVNTYITVTDDVMQEIVANLKIEHLFYGNFLDIKLY